MHKPSLSPEQVDEVVAYLRDRAKLEIQGTAHSHEEYLKRVGQAQAIEFLLTLRSELQDPASDV